mgnify:CR=1 FL=1
MAKSIKDMILDESPKSVKKIEKSLNSKNISPITVANFEAMKSELATGSSKDYPKLKVLITDSFVLRYETSFGFAFEIVPLKDVQNAYRSNIVNGEFEYDNFHLAIETAEKTYYFAQMLKNKKTYTAYEEIIADIKKKAGSWNRGEAL